MWSFLWSLNCHHDRIWKWLQEFWVELTVITAWRVYKTHAEKFLKKQSGHSFHTQLITWISLWEVVIALTNLVHSLFPVAWVGIKSNFVFRLASFWKEWNSVPRFTFLLRKSSHCLVISGIKPSCLLSEVTVDIHHYGRWMFPQFGQLAPP